MAHIVVRMVVATLTEAWSWLNPAVRSLLLRRSEWSAGQDFVGTRGGDAAGRTRACTHKWRSRPALDVRLCPSSGPKADMPGGLLRGHKRTKVRPRSYFGLRGNGMNPSRFGILTLGSDCASITSFDPTIPLRLRI